MPYIYPENFKTIDLKKIGVYRVSKFRWFYGLSPLLLKIESCGFRGTVLLFCETKESANRNFIALFVFDIQGEFENSQFSGTPRISVVFRLIGKAKTNIDRVFCVESSGVVSSFSHLIFFEILTKPMFF